MSPTIYREGQYRFYFNSNEEPRQHVHVEGQNGKAKFWLEPIVALADFHSMKTHELKEVEHLIETHQQEFKDAWTKHFRQ